MRFLKIFLNLLIFTIMATSHIYGYEGYEKYPMEGNSIFPLTDVNIMLSKINVLMENKERRDVNIKVNSEYILENLSDEEVTFKAAFPVESNCIDCTKMPDDFKVLINKQPVLTSITKILRKDYLLRIYKKMGPAVSNKQREYAELGVREGKLYEIPIIVFDISFKPKEKKTVSTFYTLEWYLDPGAESLEYDLSTLYIWKGNIEKASFKLVLPEELIDVSDIKTGNAFKWRWPKPKISIHPKNYQINKTNNSIEWFFGNLNQKKIGHISVDLDYRAPGVVGE